MLPPGPMEGAPPCLSPATRTPMDRTISRRACPPPPPASARSSSMPST
ncbi:hypothetical protein ACFFX0_15010 [Citricoccus parietis]|uniref:Uncharacterized protein n=1 Tax=Citricoccus parietis TaxID=592307 RepID=A0ABV5G1T0_9MICC